MDTTQMQARRAEAKRNAAAFRQMVRYRLDHRWQPDGKMIAILTVALPDHTVMRFTSTADPHEVAKAMGYDPEVSGFLGKVWNGVKKVTKKVATSGVFKTASTALMAAAPLLGPLGAPALAAGAAMKASTALLAARTHSANGNTDAAAKLVAYANDVAKVGDKINIKAAAKIVAPKLKAAITSKRAPASPAKPRALPASTTLAARKKPAAAATIPLSTALRDHAQASSARLYTMMLKPA